MRAIESIRRTLRYLFETLAIVAFVVMLGSSLLQILFRYVLNEPLMWTEELARLMCVITTYFGSLVVLLLREHIYVALLDEWVRGRAALVLATLVDLLVAWFLVSVTIGCWLMTEATWTTYTATMDWFRMGYIYLAVGVSTAVMTLILALDIYTRLVTGAGPRKRAEA